MSRLPFLYGGSRHVLRTTSVAIASTVLSISLVGCVDGFTGSNIQIDIRPGFPVQAHVAGPVAMGELPANSHFTLQALRGSEMFEIARFEVHRLVDLTSPCFIDVGDRVPHPGLHVSQYAEKIAEDTGISDIANPPPGTTERQRIEAATAIQRETNVGLIAGTIPDATGSTTGLQAITSASTAVYPGVATDCTGPAELIPPATCTDDASNRRRLALCQAAWDSDAGFWEGTDRVLTAPLNGVTRGLVDGVNPINPPAPVGGAMLYVDNPLTNITGYAVYFQIDGGAEPGMQILGSGPITMPTRGVSRVTLVNSATMPTIVILMAVFSDLGSDSVHF